MWFGLFAEELRCPVTSYPVLNSSTFQSHYNNITMFNGTSDIQMMQSEYLLALKEFRDSLFTHNTASSIILIGLYLPIFTIAFFGNILALLVVVFNRTMRNVTNFLLVNLAFADLSVSVVCIPIAVGESLYKAWLFGDFMCKFTTFLQGTTVTASVFTISLLSVDRFLAIKKPVVSRRLAAHKTAALRVIGCIWIMSALPMIPLFLFRELDVVDLGVNHRFSFCRESWLTPGNRLGYDAAVCIMVYFVPGLIISRCYIGIGKKLWHEDENLHRRDSEVGQGISRQVMHSRRRIARMLFVLAVLFCICWLPYHITCIYLDLAEAGWITINPGSATQITNALRYTILIGHSNSAINPLLYFYVNKGFRKSLKRLCSSSEEGKPRKVVVKYSPGFLDAKNGSQRKPFIQVLSRSGKSRSRSTGSFRFSRSTNTSFKSTRSFRSSGSFRRHDPSAKSCMKPALTKLRDAQKQEEHQTKASVPEIKVEVVKPEDNDPLQSDKDAAWKHRRDMFNFTLSIPTTINEESRSSRSGLSSPVSRNLPSAILEEGSHIVDTFRTITPQEGSTSNEGHHELTPSATTNTSPLGPTDACGFSEINITRSASPMTSEEGATAPSCPPIARVHISAVIMIKDP